MIRVLGVKRVFILLVLILLNAGAAAFLYGYVTPEQMKTERTLRSTRSQISRVQADIDRLQVEFDQLEEQQARFEGLRADGFFNDQSRRQAEDLLKQVQTSSQVISAVANISAGAFEDNEEAAKAEHRVLTSSVVLDINALDDVDVFRYLYLVEKHFPGHISYEQIEMKRDMDVNAAVLRGIATGVNPPMVRANIELSWRTMIPESQVRR